MRNKSGVVIAALLAILTTGCVPKNDNLKESDNSSITRVDSNSPLEWSTDSDGTLVAIGNTNQIGGPVENISSSTTSSTDSSTDSSLSSTDSSLESSSSSSTAEFTSSEGSDTSSVEQTNSDGSPGMLVMTPQYPDE